MVEVRTENDIIRLIQKDSWMMEVLTATESLGLPDWWIGAGFVRNKVWNVLHQTDELTTKDIDVIYFDKADISKETEKGYENVLDKLLPSKNWTVKNMARMHLVNGDQDQREYFDSIDGFSHWPETVTCVAVKKVGEKLILEAPYGIDDIVNLQVRPNIKYPSPTTYTRRIREKDWKDIWPKLRFFDFDGNDITAEIRTIEQ